MAEIGEVLCGVEREIGNRYDVTLIGLALRPDDFLAIRGKDWEQNSLPLCVGVIGELPGVFSVRGDEPYVVMNAEAGQSAEVWAAEHGSAVPVRLLGDEEQVAAAGVTSLGHPDGRAGFAAGTS